MKNIVNCNKPVWLLLELFSLDFFTQTFVCLTAQEMSKSFPGIHAGLTNLEA